VYAKIKSWFLAKEPFTVANKLLTPNGRPKRLEVTSHYQNKINSIYESKLVAGASL
jgi:long-subunit acyl-CoA synthetase (AMP-forming)